MTRLDGRRLYLERPEWTTTHLRGVYPAGWPPPPSPRDSVIVVPRDSIARVEQLQSSRGRTLVYLGVVVGLAIVLAR